MEITRVAIRYPSPTDHDRCIAYATATLDDELVIKNMRIVRRDDGSLLLAMPCQPRNLPCDACNKDVPFNHHFCHYCGEKLDAFVDPRDKKYQDHVHPANQDFRDYLEDQVFMEYERHKKRWHQGTE